MSNRTRYFVAVTGAILVVGLGTGIVASYMGFPVSVFSSAAGPEELEYVPADAAVVAYANVRDVMNSQLRKRFQEMEPSQEHKNDFEEKTGLNFEQDIDTVVAAMMPKGNIATNPEGAFLILARGRFQAARLEALALEHGATIADYQGKRLITHHDTDSIGPSKHEDMAVGFVEADLIAFGSVTAVKASIDARRENRNVVSNVEMMRLVSELDNANAWAVGRFDAIAGQTGLPTEIASQMPAITRFSAAGHINGGVSGVLKAETKDEASAQNMRDVLKGLLALAKMQAGSKPGMQQLADSLILSGDGKNVALSFSVPSEVLDVLEGLAKGRKGM
ncbi:MAG: hypothetical protein EXQ50_13530 [Acidobacteria bacterium]|nr:hypothetical protein [Acidobacteriota bacterium]